MKAPVPSYPFPLPPKIARSRCRAALQGAGLATSQTFDLTPSRPLPPLLLPFMRLAAATTPQEVQQVCVHCTGYQCRVENSNETLPTELGPQR